MGEWTGLWGWLDRAAEIAVEAQRCSREKEQCAKSPLDLDPFGDTAWGHPGGEKWAGMQEAGPFQSNGQAAAFLPLNQHCTSARGRSMGRMQCRAPGPGRCPGRCRTLVVGQDLRCFMPGCSLGPPPLLTPDPRTAKASASAVGPSLASPGWSRLPTAMPWVCFPSPCPAPAPPPHRLALEAPLLSLCPPSGCPTPLSLQPWLPLCHPG